MDETDFNPDRRLCPDGSCVGLIGADGRCTVCARTADAAAAGEELPEPETTLSAASSASGSAAESDGFDPNRRLCDDGSCVGLIGPDGRCTVCGQAPEKTGH